MTHNDIVAAIKHCRPGSDFSLSGSDLSGLVWKSENPPPSEREVTDAHTEVVLEKVASAVRIERDKLLTKSDWTQVADAPVDQAAWATYRQELRDIPQQEGFPESVVWPTRPV